MRDVLGVDLAAKRSGVCFLSRIVTDPLCRSIWTSKNQDRHQFFESLEAAWDDVHLVCEDIPPGLPKQENIRNAYQMQGRLLEWVDMSVLPPYDVTLIYPMTWMRHHKVWGTGSKWAYIELAKELEPELQTRKMDKKDEEDSCAAVLIAQWAHDMLTEHGTLDVNPIFGNSGVSSYMKVEHG